jgi:hypothetical protein
VEHLEVVFQHGLVSDRFPRRTRRIAGSLGHDPATFSAALLAKTDLLTQMVGEFPELQGRMGFHYATHDGEPTAVATAIEEQYLPRHAGDRLPVTAAGRALAIADRADLLAGVFALGKRPTGNKDPFGLRRAALGLLRILVEDGVDLDLPALLARAIALQPAAVKDAPVLAAELHDFIVERARAWYLDGLAQLPAGAVTAETFRPSASSLNLTGGLSRTPLGSLIYGVAGSGGWPWPTNVANILRGGTGVGIDPAPEAPGARCTRRSRRSQNASAAPFPSGLPASPAGTRGAEVSGRCLLRSRHGHGR